MGEFLVYLRGRSLGTMEGPAPGVSGAGARRGPGEYTV